MKRSLFSVGASLIALMAMVLTAAPTDATPKPHPTGMIAADDNALASVRAGFAGERCEQTGETCSYGPVLRNPVCVSGGVPFPGMCNNDTSNKPCSITVRGPRSNHNCVHDPTPGRECKWITEPCVEWRGPLVGATATCVTSWITGSYDPPEFVCACSGATFLFSEGSRTKCQ